MVIALYAVVLSNANHRRQNVRRAVCGWTAPFLKPLRDSPSRLVSFCFSGIRLLVPLLLRGSSRRMRDPRTVAKRSPRRHRFYIRNRASPFAKKRRNSRSSMLNIPASFRARRNVDLQTRVRRKRTIYYRGEFHLPVS